MLKKIILIMIIGLIVSSSPKVSIASEIFASPSITQSENTPLALTTYPVRPDRYGEYGGILISNFNDGTMGVRLKVQGVHAGQKASTKWTLKNYSTGNTIRSIDYINQDFDGTFYWFGIPNGTYTLNWVSYTSNKTEGFYGVNCTSCTTRHLP